MGRELLLITRLHESLHTMGVRQETEHQVRTCTPGRGGRGRLLRQKLALVSELVEPQTRCSSPGPYAEGTDLPGCMENH